RDHLSEVVLRRGAEMEAADDGVNLLHARDFLSLTHRIDDADVTARADHDETLVADIEAGRMLVNVLVGHGLSLQLGRGEGSGIAAESVLHLSLDERVGQHLLDACTRDLAGGKRVAFDYSRRLAQNGGHLSCGELAAVERAEVAELSVALRLNPMTEVV